MSKKINKTGTEYNLGKVMGSVAFAKGIYAAMMDAEAMAHLEGREVGTSMDFLTGWANGNMQARLAA